MFQFRRFPVHAYLFSMHCTDIVRAGCPIRISPDISLVYSSPRLFAVSHVLLRLPVPRHSPCALLSLTFSTELLALHYVILFVCSQLEYFFMNSSIFVTLFSNVHDFSRRLSYTPISRLSFLCSVFKVRCSGSNPEFRQISYLSEFKLQS